MNLHKQAFTLVELIVVVTILAVLSAIWFVSYSWYLAWTRDTNRISQLKSISEWLELYWRNKYLPIPDDRVDIKSNWTLIAYQWYAWKSILEAIEYSTPGLDPKDKTYFSYYLSKNKKDFQLMAFLEEEDNLQTAEIFNKSSAVDYYTRFPTVFWKKLWILTDNNNTPIQEVTAIKSAWSLDIADVWTLELKSFLNDWDSSISWTWTTFAVLKTFVDKRWKYCASDNLTCSENIVTITSDAGAGWNLVDTNCDINDIKIWTQTWAWCNSTIWNWVIYDDWTYCLDYQWNDLTDTSCTWFLEKENSFNSTYWVNNIWGKLYTWDNSSTACTNWYHVPSETEWALLEETLNWSSCRTWDQETECNWLGWMGHTSKTSENNIVEALKVPLSGHKSPSSWQYNRGKSAFFWTSTVDPNDSTKAYNRYFEWGMDGIDRRGIDKAYSSSIRCIKDSDVAWVIYGSCKAILDAWASTWDWVYTIDPEGNWTWFSVYCDMTSDWGGWTLYTAKATHGYWDVGDFVITEALKSISFDKIKWNYTSPVDNWSVKFPLIYTVFNSTEWNLLIGNPADINNDDWENSSIHYSNSTNFANAFTIGEWNTSSIDISTFRDKITSDWKNKLSWRIDRDPDPDMNSIVIWTAWFWNRDNMKTYFWFPWLSYTWNWHIWTETFSYIDSEESRDDWRSISIFIK